MSIERTDEWLEKHFNYPEEICKQLILSTDEEEPEKLYHYLLRFGMYRPNQKTRKMFEGLVKDEIWMKVQSIYEHYRNKWNGPDIPVYIFPRHIFWNETDQEKSGVSFKNKMFLFLNNIKDKKDLEALIIHEYHHICRLNGLDKPMNDFTLLDSMVIEGLAEFAVTKYCGKQYNAKWISFYTKEELSYYWKKYIEKNLKIRRTERMHDSLLYGKGRFPKLIGYSLGYYLVINQKECKEWTIGDSFSVEAEEIVSQFDFLQ